MGTALEFVAGSGSCPGIPHVSRLVSCAVGCEVNTRMQLQRLEARRHVFAAHFEDLVSKQLES